MHITPTPPEETAETTGTETSPPTASAPTPPEHTTDPARFGTPRTPSAGSLRPPAGRPAPARSAPARKGPPGRRDSRRPETHRSPSTPRPSASALRAAAQREREGQPPYWFARRLLLVLSGQNPAHTLLRHARGPAYEQLSALARLAPLRPRGTDRTTPALLEARGTRPRDGVIEAFARVSTGGRQRAIAFRLEYDAQRRWLCAAVELDGLSGAAPPAR